MYNNSSLNLKIERFLALSEFFFLLYNWVCIRLLVYCTCKTELFLMTYFFKWYI